MLARNLKKGMLVRARPGYAIVIRQFPHRPPGVKDGEVGFTVVRSDAVKFVRLVTAITEVLSAGTPVMYYGTTKEKSRKKIFTKHVFLVGSELIYLNCGHCRGLEPIAI
jgi:hypothetical protein